MGLGPFPPTMADIGACPSVPPPRNERAAIARSALAFDGVVVRGRALPGSTPGTLVSPLVFRVLRVVKGSLGDYGARLSSPGVWLVTVWDAAYWRPASRRKASEPGHKVRFPGEIEVMRGQAWRIYVLNEGVNFTATTCLGSHVLARRPTTSPAPTSPPPTTPVRTAPTTSVRSGSSGWILGLAVAAIAMVLLVLGALVARRRRSVAGG
ncbi:MAG: hypothetical protein M3Q23_15535 [Actinomycetota bacterium]|nr:hypothetical protein [Actinomycetota bacterium]